MMLLILPDLQNYHNLVWCRRNTGCFKNTGMKFWIVIIFSFFVITCTLPLRAQSVKDSKKAIKKKEKADIDSLFIVYSLPINVSYTNTFKHVGVADSLIALLKRRKYQYLDSSSYAELFKSKLNELTGWNDLEGMREFVVRTQSDKNYYVDKIRSANPFAQRIQLSFLKTDSGINYIHVRRRNSPNDRNFRDWVFTYPDSESPDQVAGRILDSLINTK